MSDLWWSHVAPDLQSALRQHNREHAPPSLRRRRLELEDVSAKCAKLEEEWKCAKMLKKQLEYEEKKESEKNRYDEPAVVCSHHLAKDLESILLRPWIERFVDAIAEDKTNADGSRVEESSIGLDTDLLYELFYVEAAETPDDDPNTSGITNHNNNNNEESRNVFLTAAVQLLEAAAAETIRRRPLPRTRLLHLLRCATQLRKGAQEVAKRDEDEVNVQKLEKVMVQVTTLPFLCAESHP